MKLLVISWFFPPSNTMGALRVGKFAEYLLGAGHDVRIVAALEPPVPQSLEIGLPAEVVSATPWIDVNRPPRAAADLLKRLRAGGATASPQPEGSPPAVASAPRQGLLNRLSRLYLDVTNIPDYQIGWYPHALGAATRLARDWRPDLILASGPPFTSLLIGRRLHKRLGVPWVAELRDRWTDDPYFPPPPWRGRLDARLERLTLASAAGLVTVSEPWARFYAQKYAKPCIAVYNGFDPKDYGRTAASSGTEVGTLRIVYTGRIYPGRRDPAPLFAAMARTRERLDVRADFYGAAAEHVMGPAEQAGVADRVSVYPHIPYAQSIAVQQQADVLLLMQWNDPKEQGNVPGKLFEYLGARRPILALGLPDGEPARIIAAQQAGLLSNAPEEIAGQLAHWLQVKAAEGRIPDLPEARIRDYTRAAQYRRLADFLQCAAEGGTARSLPAEGCARLNPPHLN